MRIGQAQDLPLQGWCRRASVGATLVVARCVENTAHGHLLDRRLQRRQAQRLAQVTDRAATPATRLRLRRAECTARCA